MKLTLLQKINRLIWRDSIERLQDILLDFYNQGLGNIQTITGTGVDNTDPLNPVINSHVTQTIANGQTDTSPSEDVIFDALLLKANLVGGKVPAGELPSYVDDVVEVANLAALPVTGETGKIYVTIDDNLVYRWTGSIYVEVSPSSLSPLTESDEGNGVGIFKTLRNAADYGNVGLNAVDLSTSSSASATKGATGNYAFTAGINNTASGVSSTSLGALNDSSGTTSVSIGGSLFADSFREVVLGTFNTRAVSPTPTSFVATDRILTVGNGTGTGLESDALIILKNGVVTAPSVTVAEINTAGNTALTTKEYNDATYLTMLDSPLAIIDEGNGNGIVRAGRVAANYGNVGLNAVDLSFSNSASSTKGATGTAAFAEGTNTKASADNAHAEGVSTNATNVGSHAEGGYTTANGLYAHSEGVDTGASGYTAHAEGDTTSATGSGSHAEGGYTSATATNAHAEGRETVASGNYSHSGGNSTEARSAGETAIGYFNTLITPVDGIGFNPLDRVFGVGNGASSGARSDALIILKNGTITAPSLTNALITTAGAKALVTKEYLDVANYWTKTGNDIQNTNTGNTTVKIGSGNTFRILDAGNTQVGAIDENSRYFGQGFVINVAGGLYSGVFSGEDANQLTYRSYGSSVLNKFVMNNTNIDNSISGTKTVIKINPTINPISGTAETILYDASPTINQTGGANGITRGLYINPTLTSAFDFRAIEVTGGKVILATSVYADNTAALAAGLVVGEVYRTSTGVLMITF